MCRALFQLSDAASLRSARISPMVRRRHVPVASVTTSPRCRRVFARSTVLVARAGGTELDFTFARGFLQL